MSGPTSKHRSGGTAFEFEMGVEGVVRITVDWQDALAIADEVANGLCDLRLCHY